MENTSEKIEHISASSSHYDQESETYDQFNEKNAAKINQVIESILSEHNVKAVLDLSCGTGSQVFWLASKGFTLIGVDINKKMLSIARKKAVIKKSTLQFKHGDMRTSQLGKFDAVITIFNAIGHLTKSDFIRTIKNVSSNLKPGGLYVFDIFNLDYLLEGDNITQLTIDWQKKQGDKTIREIQYSTISNDGILASHDIYHQHIGNKPPHITNAFQTLQTYRADELIALLNANGFELLKQLDISGHHFNKITSERILTVAKKRVT